MLLKAISSWKITSIQQKLSTCGSLYANPPKTKCMWMYAISILIKQFRLVTILYFTHMVYFSAYWFINWPYDWAVKVGFFRIRVIWPSQPKETFHTSSLDSSFFFFYKPVLEHQTWTGAHVIDTSVDRSAPRLWGYRLDSRDMHYHSMFSEFPVQV